MLVGWDVNMPNCVACRAKHRKARRGNKKEDNQRVETKEVREKEGGGALERFFFTISIFIRKKCNTKNKFISF